MPTKKQIITITVLGILAFILGYWINLPKESGINPPKESVGKRAKAKKTIERKDVVGTYERKEGTTTYRLIFLANGTTEYYTNKRKNEPHKWSLADSRNNVYIDKEIHLGRGRGTTLIWRINLEGSITRIGEIRDGKRATHPKEEQRTYKKIK